MIDYMPVEDVEKAPNCAMLFILAETEEYFDNKDHGVKAYERAKGPKKLVTIPGITHYGIYRTARPQAQKLAIEWFDEHLKPQGGASPTGGESERRDWPMYNHDVLGSRHSRGRDGHQQDQRRPAGGEVAVPRPGIGPGDRGHPCDADRRRRLGLLRHGRRTRRVYKLTPDGKLAWSYRNPGPKAGPEPGAHRAPAGESNTRFRPTDGGFVASALVSGDSVYFADNDGWIYALDRETGPSGGSSPRGPRVFRGPIRSICCSPRRSWPRDKLICGGGAIEQGRRRQAVLPWEHGARLPGGARAEDRADRLEVRPRPQARAARSADGDQG